MMRRGVLALFIVVLTAHIATAMEWELTFNVLPTCHLESALQSDTSLPALTCSYSKPHGYIDRESWIATCHLDEPMDLSQATRFTCQFQTNAGHGYYSGRWYLRLVDAEGHQANYLIHKEAWRARQPVFVEQALADVPEDVDLARITEVQIRGYASVHQQQSKVWIKNIRFDRQPVGEADARRAQRWSRLRSAAPASESFLVHPVPVYEQLFRDGWQDKWTFRQPSPIRMHVGQGGHDDYQIAILPASDSGEPLHVSATDLRGASGATISTQQVRLHEVLWVPTLPEDRPDVYEGWYPDILRPMADGLVPVDPQRLSVVWVEFEAPATAQPGKYRGCLEFSREGVTRRVPLAVTVHDFRLPQRPTLRTSFWFFPRRASRAVGIEPG